ncbi:MAG: BMP family protein [Fimbriimonadaceae bacterium]|nr:BMP family protein [Chthonomonadaceae bacterium]MCO5296847.1 BMP family protein [Fimbriimonadaceae bacterium]
MMRWVWMAALAAVVAGCSGGSGSADLGDSSFKVALLTPGPVSDAGWSAMAYEGLQAIHDELGAEVNNQEAKGTQIRDAMRAYAQQGYSLVFGHGYEYNEPAIEVAKDFPKTMFVSSSGGQTAPNVGAFRFYLEQGFYLAGFLAGASTETGTVAMIGGPDVPSIRSTFKAFRAGAEAARTDVKVIEVFTGQDSDVAAAKQATLKAIEQGADRVIHQANAAAQGVFDACQEKKVYAFGANLNQNDNPSGVVLGSAIIQAKPAFVALAKEVKSGTFKGRVVLMGMREKAVDFFINPNLVDRLPMPAVLKFTELHDDILSGKLSIPKDDF